MEPETYREQAHKGLEAGALLSIFDSGIFTVFLSVALIP